MRSGTGRSAGRLSWSLLALVLFGIGSARAQTPVFHPQEGRADCTECHRPGEGVGVAMPSDHTRWPTAECRNCHVSTGGAAVWLYGAFIPFAVVFVFGMLRSLRRLGMMPIVGKARDTWTEGGE